MIDYKKLATEQQNPASSSIDTFSIEQIVSLMNKENMELPQAIDREKNKIIPAVKLIVSTLKSNGRIFFIGAGTSGRLGVLESAELPPTFNTDPQMAQAIMAGGKQSVFRSKEGAEDNKTAAEKEVKKRVKRGDLLIGIAASGVTPFVRSALIQAKKMKVPTVLITCSFQQRLAKEADIIIAPAVGPEIIAGSTRLKAGTVTKMVLNMLTTASMVRLGKVYGNKMVDLQPKSKKLKERGIRLIEELAQLSRKEAARTFGLARGNVKTAILMAKKNLTYDKAKQLLNNHHGFLSECLKI